MSSLSETIELNDGHKMPLFGFGCWAMEPDPTYNSVLMALKVGYKLIDTATCYENEEAVGRALKDSGLKRDEYFLVTKLDNYKHGFDGVKESMNTSLQKLGLEFVDLILIHTPMPGRVLESWRGLMELKKEGKAKSIGVSNFNGDHIKALLDAGLEKPAVNQFELHPLHRQDETVNFCREYNISVMGYCPLARGQLWDEGKYPIFDELALKLKRSKAQLFLRWAIQKRYITIPKSANPERIKENSYLFDFEINEEDMTRIEQLEDGVIISFACKVMSMSWNEIKDNDKPGSWQ